MGEEAGQRWVKRRTKGGGSISTAHQKRETVHSAPSHPAPQHPKYKGVKVRRWDWSLSTSEMMQENNKGGKGIEGTSVSNLRVCFSITNHSYC